MKTLLEIAKKSGTIKQYLKDFLPRYEQLFTPVRFRPVTILEIGIGGYKAINKGGGSLIMWANFFPNSLIVGLDINEKKLELPLNVKVEQGSQTDAMLLNKLVDKYNGFDIVIDDASHITQNTIVSFEKLYQYTKLFYIVEDLHMAKAAGTKEYFSNVKGADFNTKNLCVITK